MMRYLCCSLCLICFSCGFDNKEQFSVLAPSRSGVTFTNVLKSGEEFNIIEYLYYYNGGGVAAGDFNNDGLVDIFFAGNEVNDALFINKGNLVFEDHSESSGIVKFSGWSTGVTVVDINADGWLDIYVSRLGDYKIHADHNRLFINQQDGTFKEEAESFGLAFSGFATQSCFFDYDRDGDLDCYQLNHSVKRSDQFVRSSEIRAISDTIAGDRLLRNDGNRFIDVTAKAGICSSSIGFGLGVAAADVNGDGWLDLYVGNDFHENDYLYLNNCDGTFTDVIELAVGHTSNFTMGTAIADINGDGMLDIFTLDMQPDDEVVFKNSGGWENLQIYDFKRSFGYHHQSSRNALQLNLGVAGTVPVFSECAGLYDLHATDWSWSPLVADFDMDGDQDVFVANGIVKRPNDMDFVNYVSEGLSRDATSSEMISMMSSGAAANILFVKEGTKYRRTKLGGPSVSNGACLADLDNDGDWDIITNDINSTSKIWINNANPERFVKIALRDTSGNTSGLGATILLQTSDGKTLASQLISSSSGFLSMNECVAIFPDSGASFVTVNWADGLTTKIGLVESDTVVVVTKAKSWECDRPQLVQISRADTLPFNHSDKKYNEQINQPLIPYLQSNLSPIMTKNKDGELFVSQGKGTNGYIIAPDLHSEKVTLSKKADVQYVDETDAVFFDADGDGDDDLYVAIGGMELNSGNPALVDRLYIKSETGYEDRSETLPLVAKNSSAVASCDFDQDGDLDLFVGVQGVASQYGVSEHSYLLENIDNKYFAPHTIGLSELVYDAAWADLDKDGRDDLVVVGHWMPITIFLNKERGFIRTQIPNSAGLWFCVELADVDGDGAIDILAGNFGENHRLQVDPEHPMHLYLEDFDGNGSVDPIVSYVRDGVEYPYSNLDLILKQLPSLKKRFQKFSEYSNKDLNTIFEHYDLELATVRLVDELSSHIYFNEGGKWDPIEMPPDLQRAPIWSLVSWGGGFVAGGNLHDVDPNIGRQDALPVTHFDVGKGRDISVVQEYPAVFGEVRSFMALDSMLVVGLRNRKLTTIMQ